MSCVFSDHNFLRPLCVFPCSLFSAYNLSFHYPKSIRLFQQTYQIRHVSPFLCLTSSPPSLLQESLRLESTLISRYNPDSIWLILTCQIPRFFTATFLIMALIFGPRTVKYLVQSLFICNRCGCAYTDQSFSNRKQELATSERLDLAGQLSQTKMWGGGGRKTEYCDVDFLRSVLGEWSSLPYHPITTYLTQQVAVKIIHKSRLQPKSKKEALHQKALQVWMVHSSGVIFLVIIANHEWKVQTFLIQIEGNRTASSSWPSPCYQVGVYNYYLLSYYWYILVFGIIVPSSVSCTHHSDSMKFLNLMNTSTSSWSTPLVGNLCFYWDSTMMYSHQCNIRSIRLCPLFICYFAESFSPLVLKNSW